MSEPRQKTVAMTPAEKRRLDRAKQAYEDHTGDTGDWGRFLGIASILGLAALGIYKLVTSSRQNPAVTCAVCGERFFVAPSDEELPPALYVRCPNPGCGAEMVVNFDAP